MMSKTDLLAMLADGRRRSLQHHPFKSMPRSYFATLCITIGELVDQDLVRIDEDQCIRISPLGRQFLDKQVAA